MLRTAARHDITAAVDHYRAHGGDDLALRFVDAVQAAFRRMARHPGIGSPRHGLEAGIDDLRSWPLRRFPQLVFYRDTGAALDIWRVLHAQRDIPAWMQESA